MTEYNTVFSVFRDKVTDTELVMLDESQEYEVLYGYMKNAISKFGRLCSKLADRDDEQKCFTDDLTEMEIDILTELMVVAWLKPKYLRNENFRNNLSTKDYSFYSPANLLNQLRQTYESAQKNARSMMNTYSVLNSGYETLSTK